MAAAEKQVVELPVDVLEQMVAELKRSNDIAERNTRLLAEITQYESRRLAQAEDAAIRAARKVDSNAVLANVRRAHKRMGL